MTGDASVDGGRCCVANVRLAGGGRDQFGGSESGASSAGGDIERSRFEVLISANVPRLEFSIRSFPVPKSAVFLNEPFLFVPLFGAWHSPVLGHYRVQVLLQESGWEWKCRRLNL